MVSPPLGAMTGLMQSPLGAMTGLMQCSETTRAGVP
jgi:hypothetical protein